MPAPKGGKPTESLDSFEQKEADAAKKENEEGSSVSGSQTAGSSKRSSAAEEEEEESSEEQAESEETSQHSHSESKTGRSTHSKASSKQQASEHDEKSAVAAAASDGSLADDVLEEGSDDDDSEEEESESIDQDEDIDEDLDEEPDFEDDEWEDENEEEESEEEVEVPDEEKMSDEEARSEGAPTVTTVSNEMEVGSELEFHELNRQPAHLFPEPPWAGIRDESKKLMISCLLPLLLIVLFFYALFRCIQAFSQCVVDVTNVGAAFIWLLIRVILSPLVLLWRLFIPTYMQRYVDQQYDQKVGRRLRRALHLKKTVVAAIVDLPNVFAACGYAAYDTCLVPFRHSCGSFLWTYLGQYIDRFVLKPVADTHINRMTSKRRKHQYSNRGDHDIKMMKRKQEQLARRQKREARDKAKKLRRKKRMQEMHVTLQVDQHHPAGATAEKHQFKDKKATDRISRTMIVERRYAVAIGFFWCIVGFTMLIQVLDGVRGERCTICDHNEEIQMQVCRHGIGRDCAFHLHRIEVLIAFSLMSMGMILIVYSTFLYKPRGLGAESAKKDLLEKMQAAEKRLGSSRKGEDADMLILNDLQMRMNQATAARIFKKVYMRSPCRSIQQYFSRRSGGTLRFIFDMENRHNMLERSIRFQEKVFARIEKLLGRVPLMATVQKDTRLEEEDMDPLELKMMKELLEEQETQATTMEDRRKTLMKTKATSALKPHDFKKKRTRCMKIGMVICGPCLGCGLGAVWVCSKTPIPRLFNSIIKPRARRCFHYILRCLKRGGDQSGKGHMDTRIGGRGKRDGGGVSTLEDVLRRFDFLNAEEQAAYDAEQLGGQASQQDKKRMALVAEKADPLGHLETQREVGLNDVDEDNVKMEVPRQHDAFDAESPKAGTQFEDGEPKKKSFLKRAKGFNMDDEQGSQAGADSQSGSGSDNSGSGSEDDEKHSSDFQESGSETSKVDPNPSLPIVHKDGTYHGVGEGSDAPEEEGKEDPD